MNKKTYATVAERANGRCENCGAPFNESMAGRPTYDHFFGRSKAVDTPENGWLICWRCHQSKGLNDPSAATWLARWIIHGRKHGYLEAVERAQKRLEFVNARSELGT